MIPKLKFYSAGHFTSVGRWSHPVTTRRTWEFIYMIEGEAHMYTGSERFTAAAGDAFLLPADEEHGGTSDSDGRVSFIWLHFLASDADASALLASALSPRSARRLFRRSPVRFFINQGWRYTKARFLTPLPLSSFSNTGRGELTYPRRREESLYTERVSGCE